MKGSAKHASSQLQFITTPVLRTFRRQRIRRRNTRHTASTSIQPQGSLFPSMPLRFNCSCSLQSFHRISPTLVPTNSATTDPHNRPKDHQTIHKYSQYEVVTARYTRARDKVIQQPTEPRKSFVSARRGSRAKRTFPSSQPQADASGHCSSGQTNLEQSTYVLPDDERQGVSLLCCAGRGPTPSHLLLRAEHIVSPVLRPKCPPKKPQRVKSSSVAHRSILAMRPADVHDLPHLLPP